MVFEGLFAQKKGSGKKEDPNTQRKNTRSLGRGTKNNSGPIDANKGGGQKRPRSKTKTRPPKKSRQEKEGNTNGGKRGRGPSQEAMLLSSKLKEFCTQKRLGDALETYWHPSNDNVRDGHHACIVVDCCGRCGNIQEGENIVNKLLEQESTINVQTKTALLKGYAHSGMMDKAAKLYAEMESSQSARDRPNVRTLNTLMRGCLWAAATATSKDVRAPGEIVKKKKGEKKQQKKNGPVTLRVSGGVVTAEHVWPSARGKGANGGSRSQIIPDLSSYEYSIYLLSQALRCDDAVARLEEFKQAFHVKYTIEGKDRNVKKYIAEDLSVIETLGVSHLNLARAHAMLGKLEKAKKFAKSALDAVSSARSIAKDGSGRGTLKYGGKRAWRSVENSSAGPSTSDGIDHSRRDVSNSLFRAHKLTELENESKMIISACSSSTSSKSSLARHLVTRVLYFSGGGTTDLSASHAGGRGYKGGDGIDDELERRQLLNSLWFSFGLHTALEEAFPHDSFQSSESVLTKDDCKQILQEFDIEDTYVLLDDGTIDFSTVFNSTPDGESALTTSSPKRPLNIELGSGFGEWAVHQAQSNPSSDYVAVELRSDRVGQMFSKAFLNNGGSPLENLCCVGSECGSFLRSRMKEGTVSSVFVNHPEPPTQTFGANNFVLKAISEGGEEPAHMLNSETLLCAARCLDNKAEGGKLVIVTDNRWYANLICSTVLKVMKNNGGMIYSSTQLKGIQQLEVFHGSSGSEVTLFEGQPNESIGHFTSTSQNDNVRSAQQGSTYFDRLWRSGAGNHADKSKRFIICLCRSKPTTFAQEDHGRKSSNQARKKNKKRSAAQQLKRNERRLKKRTKMNNNT